MFCTVKSPRLHLPEVNSQVTPTNAMKYPCWINYKTQRRGEKRGENQTHADVFSALACEFQPTHLLSTAAFGHPQLDLGAGTRPWKLTACSIRQRPEAGLISVFSAPLR
jgi:hypothetical protein